MDIEDNIASSKPTIRCRDVPLKLLEKKASKEHFSQFGRLVKLSLKLKVRECTVQYDSHESAEFALANAGYYQGESFTVGWDVKKKQSKKPVDPDWDMDPEVRAELAAMSNEFTVKRKYNTRPEGMSVDVVEQPAVKKERKLKRTSRKIERPVIAVSKATNAINMDKQELLSKLKQPALTVEEKFRLLDTRDKLIRLMRSQKQIDISKTKQTVGTCPDMCPEKERLMREVQHQVALYEQEIGERTMNHELAVKQYSRSSADQEAPLPHELRNVDVLQMTMDYLMRKIINLCDIPDTNLAEWYHFLWDRTRGIRKDITQQELCCQGSVELIEQCARFHIHCSARLVAEDISVFDSKINTENLTKCLQTLKYMYHDLALKGEVCLNEPEFRAYIILLNLNDGNFMWEVQQLNREIQKSEEIRFALDVYSAIDKNNYTKFFKLVRSTTYLNACILLRYFLQVRTRAVSTIMKSYAPRAAPHTNFPLQELNDILAFEGINSTIDFFEYFELMINEERTHVVLDRSKYSIPDYPYMLDRAVEVIESKRMDLSVGEIICGREFVGEFQQHAVKCSFDEDGYLDLSEFENENDDVVEVKAVPAAIQRSLSPFAKSKVVEKKVLDSPGKIFSSITAQINKNTDLFKSSSDKVDKNVDVFKSNSSESTMFDMFSSDKNLNVFKSATEFKTFDAIKKNTFETSLDKNVYSKPSIPVKSDLFSSVKSVFSEPPPQYELFPENNTIFQKQMPLKQNEFANRQTMQPSSFFGTDKPNDNALPRFDILRKTPVDETDTTQKPHDVDISAAKEKARLAEEKLRIARENEIRKKQEDEARKRKQVEMQRKLEQIKRAEEKRKEEIEIKHTVKTLVDELLTKVERDYRKHRLECLKHNVIKRKVIAKWRKKIVINKRKRKAIDQSPVWLSAKTHKEIASELFSRALITSSLDLRKRYKKGISVDVKPEVSETINKANVIDIVGEHLIKNLKDREIYWKINVVTEGINELVGKAFDDYLDWKENNRLKYLLQQDTFASNKITCCIQNLSSTKANNDEADGFIFIANELTDSLLKRIYQLCTFPAEIVLILQKHPSTLIKLDDLVDDGIINKYHVEHGTFTQTSCIAFLNKSLSFLAENANHKQKSPLLDILKSFLSQHLGSELWQRISSFSKWNDAYKKTLTHPNTAITLHNEAVELIKRAVFSKACFEHPNFPEIFKEFLPSKIPNSLPCDYKYFPVFWKNSNYKKYVLSAINSLKLPKYENLHSPDDPDFQQNILNYCTKIFDNPERVFYKIMAHILKNPKTFLWTGIIEIITRENIDEINFNLPDKHFSSNTIFNQLFVVYDSCAMQKYSKEAWFYITNPIVKELLDESVDECCSVNVEKEEDYEVDWSKDRFETVAVTEGYKKQLNNITALMDDLEESMSIQREISLKVQSTLESFFDNIKS